MEIINITDEIIEINVTEAIVNVVTQTGAYPLPSNVFSVFGRTGNVVGQLGDYTTSIVAEGTNLYYTQARFNTAFGNKTTTDLTEGTNLYYTNARSRAAISENITGLEYSSASGIFSLTNGYLIPTQAMLDAKVPYTGATGNVTLGEHQLTAGQVAFDQTPTGTAGVGIMRWNDTDGTLDLGLKGGNVNLQVGQEIVARVVNKTGADLLEANYQVVRISSAQGQRLAVQLAQANNDANSTDTIGIVTETIQNNQEGFITILGQVKQINTTGSLQGETWADGDVLYLSPTTAGRITNIKPTAPQHMVVVGYVEYAHQNNGKIYAKIANGYELEELHDVAPTPYIDKGVLYRDTATNLWKSATIGTLLGYTPVPTTRTISTTAPLTGGGDLSADRTLSMPAATTSANGYLTSTDWNTFNNKQAAGNYITALTGEATASGPGSASVTLTNSAVTGKVLTGLNITGGSVSATDSILNAFGKVQNQINGLIGGSIFQSVWNASTNTPTLTSSVGTKGYYYIVDVSGTTNLNGITDWRVGDWAIYDGTAWQKVDNTDAVSSVNGFTGAVSLTTANISEATNLYYTDARARAAITLTTTGTSGAATYSGGTLNIPQYQGVLTNPVTGTGTTNTLPKFTGASTIGNSNITDTGSLITLGSNSFVNGSLSVGNNNPNGWIAGIVTSNSFTGGTSVYGNIADGTIQSAVTNTAGYFRSQSATAAASFTLVNLNHFDARQATFGAGSVVTTQRGFWAGASLVGATNNYAFQGSIPSGTNRWNLFMDGTAANYMAGQLLIGTTTTSAFALDVNGNARVQGGLTTTADILVNTISIGLGGGSQATNTRVGLNVLSANTTGVNNTGMGVFSLQLNTTSSHNTAYGSTALRNIVSGSDNNTAIGSNAGRNIADGATAMTISNSSIFIGSFTKALADNQTNQIVIGHGATGLGSNTTVIGNSSTTAATIFGALTANSFIPTSSTIPTNGMYLSGTNTLGFATNGTLDMVINQAGSIGIATTSLTAITLRISKNILGGTTAYGVFNEGVVQSDVTTLGVGYTNRMLTQATAFTLGNYYHYYAVQGSIGAGSVITNQMGYAVESNLTGATNNYGFWGNIPAAANRWNLYMNGTANNHMAGSLGIGTTSLATSSLRVSRNGTGGTAYLAIDNQTIFQSDVTATAVGYNTFIGTQATTFTLNALNHYRATQGTFGAGSTITNQFGFLVDSTLIGATNNFAFHGNIPSGTNRWNLYMAGTAYNYLGGRLGIGQTSATSTNLVVNLPITGGAGSNAIYQFGTVQSDVTSSAYGFRNLLNTAAATFTLPIYNHFAAQGGGTIGAGSVVTNQIGFNVESNMIGATNNFGFYGSLASATNTWNIYMNGTASNYLAGKLLIGSTSDSGAALQVTGTSTFSSRVRIGSFTSIENSGGVDTNLSNNATFDGTNWKYIASQEAARYLMNRNTHQFFIAPAGTAGDNITFTQAMAITSGGNLGIGISSPSATLHVNSVGSNSGNSGIVERIRNGYYIGFTARSISSNTNVFKLTGFAPVNSVAGAAVVRVLISGTKTGNDTYASIYEYTILRSGQSALNVVEQRNIGRGGLSTSVVGNEVIFTLLFGNYNEALINVEVLSINGELGNEPAVSLQFI